MHLFKNQKPFSKEILVYSSHLCSLKKTHYKLPTSKLSFFCYCWHTSAKIWTLFEQLVQVFTTNTEDLASEVKGSFELISSKLDRQWGKDETVDLRSFFRKGPIMPFLLKVSTSTYFQALIQPFDLHFTHQINSVFNLYGKLLLMRKHFMVATSFEFQKQQHVICMSYLSCLALLV